MKIQATASGTGQALLLAGLLLFTAVPPCIAADSVSVTWSSGEDFRDNEASARRPTIRRNIDLDSRPGDVTLKRTATIGRGERQRKLSEGEAMKPLFDVARNPRAGEFLAVTAESAPPVETLIARRFSASGEPLGGGGVLAEVSRGRPTPGIAWGEGADRYLAVWTGFLSRGGIFARLLAADGTPAGKEFSLSKFTEGGTNPDVVWNPAGKGAFVVVWEDRRGREGTILARKVDGKGVPEGKVTTVSPSGGDCSRPRLAVEPRSGTVLVVWDEGTMTERDIFAAVLDKDLGKVRDPFPLVFAPGRQYSPSLAFDGSSGTFLLLWEDYRDVPDVAEESTFGNAFISSDSSVKMGVDIYGALVDMGTFTAGDEFVLCRAPRNQVRPLAAFDGATGLFLALWQDGRRGYEYWSVFGRLLQSDGRTVGEEIEFSSPGGKHSNPVPVSGGGGFLAAWMTVGGRRPYRTELFAELMSPLPGASGTIGGIVVDTAVEEPLWEGLYWNAETPPATDVSFRTRSASREEDLPGSPWSDRLTESGSPVLSRGQRWLEIEGRLESLDGSSSPSLQSFTLRYTR